MQHNIIVASLEMSQVFQFPSGKDGDVKPGGIEGRLLEELSQILQFTYTLMTPPDKQWGSKTDNGSWTGMIGLVNRGQADLALGLTGITQERQEVVDFTESYFVNERTFAIKFPDLAPRAFVYTHPFDVYTWIGISVLMFIMPLIFIKLTCSKRSYSHALSKTFGNLFGQSVTEREFKSKVLQGSWWYFSYLVSSSYSAVLASLLAVPLYNSAPTNFRELAVAVRKGEYKTMFPKGSAFIPDMLQSGKGDLISIAKKADKNGWYATVNNLFEEKNFANNTAIMANRVTFNFNFGQAPLATKFISDDVWKYMKVGMIMNKNFCCKESLNFGMGLVNQFGLFKRIFDDEIYKSWYRASKTDLDCKNDHALSLDDISGPFMILMIGYVLSLCVCLGEIIYSRYKLQK
ncbi:hypothetical protein CDAR_541251 [Caerostris darwini]|nr:hypothetical protein CDAR_541251 [Caerostris darwini]